MTEKDFKLLSKNDQDIFVKKIVNKILVLAPTDNHFAIGSLFEDFQAEDEYLACLDETRQMLISSNFIEYAKNSNIRYVLTTKGKTANKLGGLFEYEKSELKKEKELLNEKNRKKWLDYIGIGGGIIGAIAGLFTLFNNDSKEIEGLNKKINSIENTIQLNNERYIEQHKEYVKHIDSLNLKINELKSKK